MTPPEPSAHVIAKTNAANGGEAGTASQGATPKPAPAVAPQPAPGPMMPPKLDAAGKPFDPDRHLEKMHPKSGRWMPKKPKRGEPRSTVGRLPSTPGTSSTAPKSSVAPDDEPEKETEAGPLPALDEYKTAALAACSIIYASGMTLGGDEWRPSNDEHANLALAFENYFRAKGTTDISPGWALTIACVAYAGPRFRQPKTVSTLQKIGGGIKRLALWWRARRTVQKIPTE